MTSNKSTFWISLFNAGLFIILILFHYSGASIRVLGANPMAVLALLVAVIMFSGEVAGVLTGVVLGIVLDGVSSMPTGFNTLTLIIISFSAALISHYLFNRNLKSAIALCLMCAMMYFGARWLVGFAFAGDIEGSFDYLIRYAVPSAVYTTVFVIPFFLMEKRLFSKIKRM